jgi:hypothetical protein
MPHRRQRMPSSLRVAVGDGLGKSGTGDEQGREHEKSSDVHGVSLDGPSDRSATEQRLQIVRAHVRMVPDKMSAVGAT